MGKFWSMLGTDDHLVYAVMISIGVAFVLEAIKVIRRTYIEYRYYEKF
jgi:hypothetical protein